MDVYPCNAPALWTAKDTVVGADKMGWSGFSAHGDLWYVGVRSKDSSGDPGRLQID